MDDLSERAVELVMRSKIKVLWTEWTFGIVSAAELKRRVREIKESLHGIPDAVQAEFAELERAVDLAV